MRRVVLFHLNIIALPVVVNRQSSLTTRTIMILTGSTTMTLTGSAIKLTGSAIKLTASTMMLTWKNLYNKRKNVHFILAAIYQTRRSYVSFIRPSARSCVDVCRYKGFGSFPPRCYVCMLIGTVLLSEYTKQAQSRAVRHNMRLDKVNTFAQQPACLLFYHAWPSDVFCMLLYSLSKWRYRQIDIGGVCISTWVCR